MIWKLLLAAASAGFGILLLEIGLRLAGYQAIYDVYSKPSIFWEYDPVLGWAHTPGSEGTYVGPRPWPIEFSAPIHINSLGLRGPEIDPLPPTGIRVLLQGDSMVAAFEVPYEQTFGALLEESLSEDLGVPVQVINAGVRGYGNDQSYLYFLEEGRGLDPDLVLHLYSANDARNNITVHRMRRPFSKAAFALEEGELELKGVPVPKYPLCSAYRMGADWELREISTFSEEMMCAFQMMLADRSALFTLLALRLNENRDLVNLLYALGSPERGSLVDRGESPGGVSYEIRLSEALLLAFAGAVREQGAAFMLVGDLPEGVDRAALARVGVDFAPTLEPPEDPSAPRLTFLRDAHFNALGHRLLAESLRPRVARALRERMKSKPLRDSDSTNTGPKDG